MYGGEVSGGWSPMLFAIHPEQILGPAPRHEVAEEELMQGLDILETCIGEVG